MAVLMKEHRQLVFALTVAVSVVAWAGERPNSVVETKASVPPDDELRKTMEWIRDHIALETVQWAVTRDGVNWVAFEGPGQASTLTFLAGNPAAPNLPVGGLRYFWHGPGRTAANPCFRLMLRFTGIAKMSLNGNLQKFPAMLVSSKGPSGVSIRKHVGFPGSSLIELDASANKYAPFVEHDSSCLDDSTGIFAPGQVKTPISKMGLLVADPELAAKLSDAIQLAIRQSTTR